MEVLEHGMNYKGETNVIEPYCPECGSYFLEKQYVDKYKAHAFLKKNDLVSYAVYTNTYFCKNCGCRFTSLTKEDKLISLEEQKKRLIKAQKKREDFCFIILVIIALIGMWVALDYYAQF